MKNSKPRAVITSEKAKSHLLQVRSIMDEMKQNMMIHQQNIGQEKKIKDDLTNEANIRKEQNQADMNLQMVKKSL
jgi:hypothetical protein